jgi:hydrogenase maturation protease
MRQRFDTILFLDAVDAGRMAGDVVLLDAAAIEARFPQVSTHRLSLGVLARALQAESGCRVCLLGVQPGSLALSAGLSPAVRDSVCLLSDLLAGLLAPSPPLDPGPRTADPRPPAVAVYPDPRPLVPDPRRGACP